MEILLYFFIALFGLIVGSFLNVLTLRVATGESIVFPGSHCPSCRHTLAWYDLLPVVSFFLLRGRCRYCQTAISWQYPLVEAVTAALFVAVTVSNFSLLAQGEYLRLLRDFIFIGGVVSLFVFDYRWFIVPDEVSLPLVAILFVLNVMLGMSVVDLLIGVAIGGGFYLALWLLSRGEWVGSGDIRLGAVLGAMFGMWGTIVALYVAYVIGGIIAMALLASGRKQMKSHLPMGVFLVIGALTAFFAGDRLLTFFFWP